MAAPSTTMFGLSDGEAKIAMCALKLFVTDGKVRVCIHRATLYLQC